MFNKVGTQKYGIVQKVLNSTSTKGQITNMFAKRLNKAGYTNTYYRSLPDDKFAISGTDKFKNTKTYLVSEGGYSTKTNTLKAHGNDKFTRTINKSTFNTSDREISGKKINISIENGKVVDKKETERGWFAAINRINNK